MNKKTKLLESLNAMNKESYSREELIPEMLRLQEQLANLTFGSTVSEHEYRMIDIYNELLSMNVNARFPATYELNKYRKLSIAFNEEIRGIKAGKYGEDLAYNALKRMNSNHVVLRNLELNDGDNHTEIDLLVIKKGIVTIVEVKNTKTNAFIDSEGAYFKKKNYNKLMDCHLGKKMNIREIMIRNILDKNGYQDMKIKKVVVFTKNIQIHNEYNGFETCYLSDLAYTIDEFYSPKIQFTKDMEKIAELIQQEDTNSYYPTEVDIKALKETFIEILLKIESSNSPFDRMINYLKHFFRTLLKNRAYQEA